MPDLSQPASPTTPKGSAPAAHGGWEHYCFVSYRHGPLDEFALAFATCLERELRYLTDMPNPVFIDRAGLGPLDTVTKIFEKQCRSVLMVCLYTPVYFSELHTFCTREWLTMKWAEDAVRQLGAQWHSRGLIVPAAYRRHLPPSVGHDRTERDFSKWVPPERLETCHGDWFRQVAEQAVELGAALLQAGINHHDVPSPTDDDVRIFLGSLAPSKPGFPTP